MEEWDQTLSIFLNALNTHYLASTVFGPVAIMALQPVIATIAFLFLCALCVLGNCHEYPAWALFNHTELAPMVSGKQGGWTDCNDYLYLSSVQGSEGLIAGAHFHIE